MITLVEPQQHIVKLWSKPAIREGETYRLMRYVLRVNYEGKVLLHNVVTGHFVLLECNEAEMIDKCPIQYSSIMKELVSDHFLVYDSFNEHQVVISLRTILRKLGDAQTDSAITSYTIFPTTACNARCYYCFEKGTKCITMTEKTANDTVDFIASHCGDNQRVFITWFGGEPTVASNRIDQISEGLHKKNITFHSKMITNGYLFDNVMVTKAKKSWHVQGVQICVDGTENSYNKIKSYVGISDNPYQRVMRNIGLLLENGIAVGLRMNFDVDNYLEFTDLLNETKERFGHYKHFLVAAHPVIGEHPYPSGIINHGNDKWFAEKLSELHGLSREIGLLTVDKSLPSINYLSCGACLDSTAVITADGGIVKCPERFSSDQYVGHVSTGIQNQNLIDKWKKVVDFDQCINCVLFPSCVRLAECSNQKYCHKMLDLPIQYKNLMIKLYQEKNV